LEGPLGHPPVHPLPGESAGRSTGPGRVLGARPVLAGEEAAAEWSVGEDAEPGVVAVGEHLPLQVAADERVVALVGEERLQAALAGAAVGGGELPGREVADPEVAHVAGADEA